MDRIEAMSAFVATADAGGLSAAARRLGRSPASVTRAIALLEERTGAELLRRTTRSIRLTEVGERYLATCRRVLEEIAEAEESALGERRTPRGVLTVTAPAAFGRIHVRPLVDAYLKTYPDVQVRLLLLDRVVSMIDEGVDVAIRIAHLPDSALIATRVGEVRRMVCASPAYLARHRRPAVPSDLAAHECVSFSQITPNETWNFSPGPAGGKPKHVKVRARLTVNGADAAIGSAVDGLGITSVLSYQIDRELAAGNLVALLTEFEAAPLPVHVVTLAASAGSAKIRAFVDACVPALRIALAPKPKTVRSKSRAKRRLSEGSS